MINTLTEGSDKLTLADANEEGANMLMLANPSVSEHLGSEHVGASAQSGIEIVSSSR